MIKVEFVDTDLLINGGGGAGGRSALAVQDEGLDVTLMVNGFPGKNDCSIFAGGLNYFSPLSDQATGMELEVQD
jgi:succinate dehydrogenase/fumarate reductase flavoprotein subunit